MTGHELSRREFLVAGAATSAALLGGYVLPVADALADLTPSSSPMIKGLNQVHYANPEVRDFARQNVDSLVLWGADMSKLQPKENVTDDTQWHRPDRNIKNAAEDKLPVYLAVWSDMPNWVTPAPGHAPADTSVKGPWAKFFRETISRYPDVTGVMPMIEPNLQYIADPQVALKTAQMIVTADKILDEVGFDGTLLVPSTSDTNYPIRFTRDVLSYLRDARWVPHTEVGWSVHTYTDIKEGTQIRAGVTMAMLPRYKWAGGNKLWIPETGYKFDTKETKVPDKFEYEQPLAAQEHAQLHNVTKNFDWARETGQVAMWANYSYQDLAWGGGGFMSGFVRIDGTPHPLLQAWPKLSR